MKDKFIPLALVAAEILMPGAAKAEGATLDVSGGSVSIPTSLAVKEELNNILQIEITNYSGSGWQVAVDCDQPLTVVGETQVLAGRDSGRVGFDEASQIWSAEFPDGNGIFTQELSSFDGSAVENCIFELFPEPTKAPELQLPQ